ncbi:hypothetical protein GCM10010329_37900 [Streptomyces spiroverticillatus]|uniref:GPP34 family phosphoprotein n=1 Tax=Streptomyces finlayi TaxID=67296 RepID=A0A918WY78_9ACTN|nr:GPP34 family phosphoprotein [Streptomyces finlayi]GHA11437.1 hypothetical protein GCM10010329_37900 [Streptomyces spiroverticillatus]GHC95003.1 hypothetical protein GCM10010334_33710 [Streptomyces finlayi]
MPTPPRDPFALPGLYLLLCTGILDGNPGSRRIELDIGVAGALLTSLCVQGRLRVHHGGIAAVDTCPTGLAHVDRVLDRVGSSARVAGVGRWVENLAFHAYGDTLGHLVRSGTVDRTVRRSFGIRLEAYAPKRPAQYERLLADVRLAFFGYAPVSRTVTQVAALLRATGLHHVAFPGIPRRRLADWTALDGPLAEVHGAAELASIKTITGAVAEAVSGRLDTLRFCG